MNNNVTYALSKSVFHLCDPNSGIRVGAFLAYSIMWGPHVYGHFNTLLSLTFDILFDSSNILFIIDVVSLKTRTLNLIQGVPNEMILVYLTLCIP